MRELENAIESAFAMGRGTTIGKRDLPHHIAKVAEHSHAATEGVTTLKDAERELVRRSLQVSRGNKSKASRLLGITRKRLYNLISRHKIGA